MSETTATPDGRLPAMPWLRAWRWPWSLKRNMVVMRRRLRDYRLHRDTHILLTRADERLLYDLGLEPLDLIEAMRRGRPVRPTIDPMRKG